MEEVVSLLNKHFRPVSVFLYGSRARADFLERSDFEIGVIFKKDDYVERSEIKKFVDREGFNIYPFNYEEFLRGEIDTPFQKKIFLRELVSSGETLSGEKVIESMGPPKIGTFDLIQDLRFNLGYALASVVSDRNGDKKTASTEFYKSCLFGTRDLVIFKLEVSPPTYGQILQNSKKLDLGEYEDLVEKAYAVRKGETRYVEDDLFRNISYLNRFIEPLLLESFEKDGNKILLR